MSKLTRFFAVVFLLAFPLGAKAWWWEHGSYSNYYPREISGYPVYPGGISQGSYNVEPPVASCVPVAEPAPAYACPTAAPPSAGPVSPPSNPETGKKPAPAVSESRSYFDAYTVAPRATDKSEGGRVQVNFWNLSGQLLTLKVDDQTKPLASGKSVRLDVEREFVWRIDDREPQSEKVPLGASALSVVIRR